MVNLGEKLRSKFYKRALFVFALLIFLAIVFWSSISLQNILKNSVDLLKDYLNENKFLGSIIFVTLAAISALLSFFTSIILVPVVIIIWGKFLTSVLLIIGWLIGSVIAYLIGRYAGYNIIKKFYSFERIEYYKNKIPAKAQFWLVFLFRLSLPSEITGYTLGIIRYNFSKYLLATALAETPFALLAAYSGDALINKKPAIFIGLIALAVIVMTSTFYLFNKKIREGRLST